MIPILWKSQNIMKYYYTKYSKKNALCQEEKGFFHRIYHIFLPFFSKKGKYYELLRFRYTESVSSFKNVTQFTEARKKAFL